MWRPRRRAPRSPAFRWPISSRSPRANGVTLRALLEELRAAGLELVAEAPFDRLQDPRRSIEEVNIAGLSLARLTVHQLPSADPLPLLKAVAELQRAVARDSRLRAAAATRQSGRADHRLRRCEARRAGAAGRRQRAVDPGGLVALRTEAGAGRADRRRRRRRRRVGGGRDERRAAAARRSKRSAATSARRGRSRSSATAASSRRSAR